MKLALIFLSIAFSFIANASQVWYLPVYDRDTKEGICMVKMTQTSVFEHEGYLFTDRPRLAFKFIYAGKPVVMTLDATGKMDLGNAFKVTFRVAAEGAYLECKRDAYSPSLEPGSFYPVAMEYGVPY